MNLLYQGMNALFVMMKLCLDFMTVSEEEEQQSSEYTYHHRDYRKYLQVDKNLRALVHYSSYFHHLHLLRHQLILSLVQKVS